MFVVLAANLSNFTEKTAFAQTFRRDELMVCSELCTFVLNLQIESANYG